ncbi:hypothetical protein HZH66_003598 [Vespula vulgaris]|uniref:Uncharacterized protein n=1 Tax=Vespula vulgaris TaxID=7454 RepID=A0A834KDJ1_VESVU|nr:hypothetical protein HZH66_003598 [Vespula vulgaris]
MSITWLSTDLGASKCYRRCAISSGLPICLQSHLTQLLPLPLPPPPPPPPPSSSQPPLTKRQALASRPSFTKSSILLIYPLAKAYYRDPRSCQITTARVTAKNGVGSLPRTPLKISSP